MKIKSIISVLCLAFFAGAIMSSCKKDEPTPPVVEDPHNHDDHGMVAFEFSHVVGDVPLVYGQTVNLNGMDVTFDRVQYYIHDITFYPGHTATDGVTLDGKYLLVNGNSGEIELGDVEMAHIHMMRFKIGVDPVSNSITSDQFMGLPASNPLSAQNPPMHWSWATGSGYRFAVMEGTYNGGANNFAYHAATDAMLRQTPMMSVHMDVEHDVTNKIHVKLDLATVFAGIDIAADDTEHGAGGTNPTLMDNLATSFSVID